MRQACPFLLLASSIIPEGNLHKETKHE
jgi:hypothetical protein